ncbi:MAG TPA: cell wall-binding repeat-containing protein [Euzebya sp.]|nr:cell wall-binding repeat-containing protein [Euzebya sp.]
MPRRSPTMILITLTLLLPLVAVVLATPAAAVEDVTPARAEGPNRFATAAVVAGLSYPQGTTRAVIATSVAPVDALAAAPLAGALDAALLLTRPDDLPAETAQALTDLGVTEVTLVGGVHVISAGVEATLQESYAVGRIEGVTPWATAARVAEQVVASAGGLPQLDEGTTVFLANNDRFPDALASSAAAYAGRVPVLYTGRDVLYPEVTQFLDQAGAQHVVLLGGAAALSAEVEAALQARGHATTRLAGPSRAETSIVVANWTAPRFGFDLTTAILARGDDFPDAVTSGQLGGTTSAPIVLSATPTVLPTTVQSWFLQHCPTLDVIQAIGGEAAISIPVLSQAVEAAEACTDAPPPPPPVPEPQSGPTYVVSPQEVVQREPAQAFEFQVTGRYDGQSFTGPIDIVLFPCANADIAGAGADFFTDADGDGGADGFGTTDTGFARVAVVNEVDISDTTVVVGAEPAADGILHFTVYSAEPDCIVPVVIDGNGDGAFNVDADGRPLEPYGLGQIFWQSG